MPGDPLWPENLCRTRVRRALTGAVVSRESRGVEAPLVAIRVHVTQQTMGFRIARDLAFELSEQGVVIVSGGAGIDTAAHRRACGEMDKQVVCSPVVWTGPIRGRMPQFW